MKPETPEAYQLLHDGSIVLAQVEANGIRVDVEYLRRARAKMRSRIKDWRERLKRDEVFRTWKKTYGDKTNLGSGQQLAYVLFRVMGIDNPNDGKLKSDAVTLETVDLPFTRRWTELEKMIKAESTFLAGIERNTVDERCHPFFNLHTVVTFRSSSDHPNFQNLPIRDPRIAKLIRRCFIPRDGHVLVEVDYGGIEVRVAACYNRDPRLIEYINDASKDMHRDMAAECYKLPPQEISKTVRYCAKNMFVFPQFYGSYYVDCARNLWDACTKMKLETGSGVEMRKHLRDQGIRGGGDFDPEARRPRAGTFEDHVRGVEKQFWGKRFPVYAEWKQQWYKRYLRDGGFNTLTGFRIDGIFRRNDVINYPIQGSAFHCLLWSLITLQRELNKRKMQTKIVGQIHDSIVADVPVREVDDYLFLAKDIMVRECPAHWDWIIVPLEIEAEVCPEGGSWFDKKEVKI